MYLSEVSSGSSRHVERLAAVARHDPDVPAADVDDLPLLRKAAIIIPLPDRCAVIECAPLHVEHLAAMAQYDFVVPAADRNNLKLLVGPTATAKLYDPGTGRHRFTSTLRHLPECLARIS